MMIFVYIIAVILALLGVLLLLTMSFRFSWCGSLVFEAKIGFVKLKYDVAEIGSNTRTKPKKTVSEKQTDNESDIALKELIPLLKETIADIYTKTKKHIFIRRFVLKINVATDDPSKTGVVYGIVSGAAASLYGFIKDFKRLSKKKDSIFFEVKPDFISERFDAFLDIKLTTRVWRGLILLYSITKGYNKYKSLKKPKGVLANVRHSS